MLSTDICIVGAGPAGAGAALKLSYLGIPSILLDKATFPRDKVCGDAISGKVTMQLQRLDPAMHDRFQALASNIDVWGIRFVPPNGKEVNIPFYGGSTEDRGPAPGHVNKRISFDNFLIDEIRKRDNIDLREATEVVGYEQLTDGWKVLLANGEQIKCRVLLSADGAHSRFSRYFAKQDKDNAHHAAAVRAYYQGVRGFQPEAQLIEFYFLPEINPGYFWIFPLPNGEANVGLGVRSDFIKKRRLNLKALLEEAISTTPELQERFANAKLMGKVVGYGLPLGSKKRRLSGHHYMLLGDAGYLVDPLTGEGIGNAFYSGFIAAEQAQQCLKNNRFDAKYMHAYDVRIDRVLRSEMRLSYRLQQLMRYTFFTNLISSIIRKNERFIELLRQMYSDSELRKDLIKPWFWFKLWWQKANTVK